MKDNRNNIVLLDSGPLSWVTNKNTDNPDVMRCRVWFKSMLKHHTILIAEINDYEVRRELIHKKLNVSLDRLDQLITSEHVGYLPITTKIMVKAAQLWAWARSTRQSTAQSAAQDFGKRVIIATTNVKDLQRHHTDTYHWDDAWWFT